MPKFDFKLPYKERLSPAETDQLKKRLVDLLRRDPKAFSEWWSFHIEGRPPLDLSGVDLSGIELYGSLYMFKLNLVGANFSGATLFNVSLSYGDLEGANFAGAKLTDVRFDDCYLADANFEGAEGLGTCTFTGARMDKRTKLTVLKAISDTIQEV